MIVGTMPYMSPEQVEGRAIDARSDLFSLGVIFYELLSGDRPFKGSSSPALMSAILRDTPDDLLSRRAEIPEALNRLVARLLEKRPEDRIQTARDIYNELRHIKGDRPTGIQRSSASRSPVENLSVAVLPFTVRGRRCRRRWDGRGTDRRHHHQSRQVCGLIGRGAAVDARVQGLAARRPPDRRAPRRALHDRRQRPEVRRRDSRQRPADRRGERHATVERDLRSASRRRRRSLRDPGRRDGSLVATLADETGVLAHSMVRSVQQTSIGDSSDHQMIVRMWGLQSDPSPRLHAELRAAFETLVEAQPDNAHAWASLANLYIVEHSLWFNPLPDPLGRALRAARRAIEIDRATQKGWLWLGITQFHLHDRRGLEEAMERAMRINPRNANVMAWMGNILSSAGDYERGSKLTARAMQINPAHPGWLHFAAFNREFRGR
jgi:cytochrome c-type biogenesis protein CcmH/NrfG